MSIQLMSTCIIVSIGCMCIGGAERTFACKSQECLWQDWYIFNSTNTDIAVMRDDSRLLSDNYHVGLIDKLTKFYNLLAP